MKEIKGTAFSQSTLICSTMPVLTSPRSSGYALAWGAEWLTMMTEAGLTVDEVAARVKFNMGISSNYFMELAKFRAGRMLWAEIVKAYAPADEESCKMWVHVVTSEFNQTLYDSHVNLLRSMTET